MYEIILGRGSAAPGELRNTGLYEAHEKSRPPAGGMLYLRTTKRISIKFGTETFTCPIWFSLISVRYRLPHSTWKTFQFAQNAASNKSPDKTSAGDQGATRFLTLSRNSSSVVHQRVCPCCLRTSLTGQYSARQCCYQDVAVCRNHYQNVQIRVYRHSSTSQWQLRGFWSWHRSNCRNGM
jgi:hypothetical protein